MRPFRLAGLSRLRRLQEDQAAAELARRAAERQRTEQRSRQAGTDLAQTALPAQGDGRTWAVSFAARAAASAALSEAQVAAEISRAEEERAQGQWSAARARTTTLDKLAHRHVLSERAAELRAEQHTIDELATQRAVRREDA